jgi:hypothetical protein
LRPPAAAVGVLGHMSQTLLLPLLLLLLLWGVLQGRLP